jgi:hypothetical protein
VATGSLGRRGESPGKDSAPASGDTQNRPSMDTLKCPPMAGFQMSTEVCVKVDSTQVFKVVAVGENRSCREPERKTLSLEYSSTALH